MTNLARPADIHIDQAQLLAKSFLIGYDEPTRTNYTLSLKTWLEWLDFQQVPPLDATRAHIEVWSRELLEIGNRFARHPKPLMASTVNGRINAVVGFYKYAHREGYITDDITQYLRRPKVPNESNREGLTRFELRAVLDEAKKTSPLDYALVCVLACNGLRIGEVCRLNVDDLHRQDGYYAIRVHRNKGNRGGDIPAIPMLSEALTHYLGTRTTGPLFLKPRKPVRLDGASANRIVKRIAKAAGVTKTITNHSFRHTHITIALNEGMPLRDLVNSMGYADARQISRYDRDKRAMARSAAWVIGAALEGS